MRRGAGPALGLCGEVGAVTMAIISGLAGDILSAYTRDLLESNSIAIVATRRECHGPETMVAVRGHAIMQGPPQQTLLRSVERNTVPVANQNKGMKIVRKGTYLHSQIELR